MAKDFTTKAAETVAAAVLVQTVFNSDERLQTLLRGSTVGQTGQDAAGTAKFLKPWYDAMLRMVSELSP